MIHIKKKSKTKLLIVLSAVMARMRSAAVSAVVPVVIGMISVPAVLSAIVMEKVAASVVVKTVENSVPVVLSVIEKMAASSVKTVVIFVPAVPSAGKVPISRSKGL